MQIKDVRFFSAELVTETLLLNIIGKELSTCYKWQQNVSKLTNEKLKKKKGCK